MTFITNEGKWFAVYLFPDRWRTGIERRRPVAVDGGMQSHTKPLWGRKETLLGLSVALSQ